MKTKKFFIIAGFLLLGIITNSEAQQLPHYTQYTFNDFAINPAIAGTHNYLQVRAFSRMQWLGVENSPQTYAMSVYGPMKDEPMGYGGNIYVDQTGATSMLIAKGTYAYNMPISSDIRISGGLSLGFMQYKLDGTSFDHDLYSQLNINDPLITNSVKTAFVPDASAGIYVWSPYFYAGISAHQLLGNKLNLFSDVETSKKGLNRLKQHYYLAGGANFILNRDFQLRPSILIREMFPTTPQVELTVKALYQRIVWGGISFRSSDAFSIMGGYIHESRWLFGLSYDVTYSQLANYSRGTIEFMFGLKFDDIK